MTFDATLKELARESPEAFLAAFDRPPTGPVKPLNVDLSTVTSSADLVFGLGEPLQEIVHLEFQSSAAAWKHADLLVYNALLFAHYRVPVHTLVLLLRPTAAHANMNGSVQYAARPGRGSMDFRYELVRLWERPADELRAADVGVAPLAMLGRLPDGLSLEDGLAAVAHGVLERVVEAPPERAKRLATDALLLTGLRVKREVAKGIFSRGARMMNMEDSDTYLMIIDEGREKHAKEAVLIVGEERIGVPPEAVKTFLEGISDLERLNRMLRRAATAATWQEILDTP